MLDEPERIGYAVTQSGVDLISGLLDNELGEESYARGTNDYYDTHAVPAGFKKEDLVLTDASLNRAVSRTLTELFRQGMFEDTYADPRKAAEVVATKADWGGSFPRAPRVRCPAEERRHPAPEGRHQGLR